MAPAISTLRASLQQINPHVEEAARGLGANPFRTLLKITLPLIKPGIIAGASLIFVLTIKELPATLILSPIGFMTLAGSIWSAASEAFFTRAAHASLILILLSSFPLVLATIFNAEDRW
jgi:iron(III) transport system permease protein